MRQSRTKKEGKGELEEKDGKISRGRARTPGSDSRYKSGSTEKNNRTGTYNSL